MHLPVKRNLSIQWTDNYYIGHRVEGKQVTNWDFSFCGMCFELHGEILMCYITESS